MSYVNKLKELKAEGKTAYSISRINSFNECKHGYNITYNQKDRGENNCYGIAGTAVHDWLEDIANNKINSDELPNLLQGLLLDLELQGVQFPSEKIKDNWVKDMTHFAEHFEKLDVNGLTEMLVLYDIEGHHIQGYIDFLLKDNEGNVVILDWKTSSEFTGDKLRHAGRQLLIYKDAIEQTTNHKVDKVGWYMAKYCELEYNGKRKTSARRNLIKDNKSKIAKELKNFYNDDMMVEMVLEQSLKTNKIPDEIKEHFTIHPNIRYYDFTDADIHEARQYMVSTIENIEIEEEFKPKDGDMKKDFYCQFLCNHRKTCTYMK